jgi:hypothetical protein
MQVTEARPQIRGVHHQPETALAGHAQHASVANRHDLVNVGVATVARIAMAAKRRPDVLALMTQPRRTLSSLEMSRLAKIVAPGVRVILNRPFIPDKQLRVHPTAIRRQSVAQPRIRRSRGLAVARVQKGLRIGESRRCGPDLLCPPPSSARSSGHRSKGAARLYLTQSASLSASNKTRGPTFSRSSIIMPAGHAMHEKYAFVAMTRRA